MDEDKKRVRAANFSKFDTKQLLQLANRKSCILENKKTDAISNKQKEEAWKNIEMQFNASSQGVQRSAKSLQQKYEGIKKDLRKTLATEKKYTHGTGGGSYRGNSQLTPEEAELADNIRLSIHGLDDHYGSDRVLFNDTSSISEPFDVPSAETAVVEVDWGNFRADMYQTRKADALQTSCLSLNDLVHEEDDDDVSMRTAQKIKKPAPTTACNKNTLDYTVIPSTSGKPILTECDEVNHTSIPSTSTPMLSRQHLIPKKGKNRGNKDKEVSLENFLIMKTQWLQGEQNLQRLRQMQDEEEHKLKMKKLRLEIALLQRQLKRRKSLRK